MGKRKKNEWKYLREDKDNIENYMKLTLSTRITTQRLELQLFVGLENFVCSANINKFDYLLNAIYLLFYTLRYGIHILILWYTNSWSPLFPFSSVLNDLFFFHLFSLFLLLPCLLFSVLELYPLQLSCSSQWQRQMMKFSEIMLLCWI